MYRGTTSDLAREQASDVVRRVDTTTVDDALDMDSSATVAQFRQFLEAGERGYYAYSGPRVVHRSWVRLGPARVSTWHEHASWELRAGQAYVHYCETAAVARGQGVFPTVLRTISRELAGEGVREVFIAATLGNGPSCKAIERAGFIEVARTEVRVRMGIVRERPLARG
jgi:L-amino acid N-acyltransferase YncA